MTAMVFTYDAYGQKISDKVWSGKYSEIATDYKEKWFDESIVISSSSDLAKKHQVVYKTKSLRKLIEKEYVVHLEDRDELESLPLLRNEILGYPDVPTEDEIERSKLREETLAYIDKLKNQTTESKFAGLHEHYANILKNTERPC